MSFDWQTEEQNWNERPRRAAEATTAADEQFTGPGRDTANPERESSEPGIRRRNPRVFLFIITVAILLVAATGMIYRQVERRLAEARQRVEAEVLASHETVLNAARAGDDELFTGFLSGRDPEWAAAQLRQVREGVFSDRLAFGLNQPAGRTAPITPTLTLSADLRSAELSAPYVYTVEVGSGLSETITLTQTAIYRRGPDRWLLAPPDPEFWGEARSMDGRLARVSYPARDAQVAGRLARDMEAALSDFCASLAGDCFPLAIQLSSDATTLADRSGWPRQLLGGSEIILPAPTLLGLPIDESSYRAVSRLYAARVVSAAAANYSGWGCCENVLFYSVFNQALLNRLGLQVWPVNGESYESVVNSAAPLAALEGLWSAGGYDPSTAEIELLRTFVDFLVNEAGTMPIAEAQRLLADDSRVAFWSWLSEVTGHQYGSPAEFERAWIGYTVSRRPAAAVPVPLPRQDLQLICRAPGAIRSALYHFDPQDGEFVRESELAGLDDPMLAALPGRDGVVVFGRNRSADATPPYIWRDGRATTIQFEGEIQTGFVPLPPVAADSGLRFFLDTPSPATLFASLAPEECTATGCRARTHIGAPLMSPDRDRWLLVVGSPFASSSRRFQSLVYLADENGESVNIVEVGWSPFWLDGHTFGYLTLDLQPTSRNTTLRVIELSTAAEGDPPIDQTPAITSAENLFTSANLAELNRFTAGASIAIDNVTPDIEGENLFIFTANPLQPDAPGRMLVYNLLNETFEPRFAIEGEPFDYRRAYSFSPDGRWVAVAALQSQSDAGGDTQWAVYVHALDGTITRRYSLVADDAWPANWLVDWSADGQWLSLTGGGYVRLIAPAANYSMPLVFNDRSCSAAVWVNEE